MMRLDWNENIVYSYRYLNALQIDGQYLLSLMSLDNCYGHFTKMATQHLLIIFVLAHLIQNRNVNGYGTVHTACEMRILPFVSIPN